MKHNSAKMLFKKCFHLNRWRCLSVPEAMAFVKFCLLINNVNLVSFTKLKYLCIMLNNNMLKNAFTIYLLSHKCCFPCTNDFKIILNSTRFVVQCWKTIS